MVTLKSKPLYLLLACILLHTSLCFTQVLNYKISQQLIFEKSSQLFPAAETFQVVLGDVDNDGDQDAIFSNMGFNNCTVWLNDGTGYFTDSGQRLTQQGHGIGLGDLDGDGDLDAFITCATYGYNNRWYYKPSKIYLNNGAGVFQDSGQDLGDTNLSGNLVQLVDIDGDADLDAFVVYYPPPGKIYLNDGTGKFSDSGKTLPFDTSWGDLDNDGDADIFIKESGVGYRTMLNDGNGNFQDQWQLTDAAAAENYHSNALGDFDGDGDLDVVITNGSLTAAKPAKILWNDGAGHFTDSGQNLPSIYMAWVCPGDLNGDDHLDAFFSILDRPNQVWLNNGAGNLVDSGLRLGGDIRTRGSQLADLDNDGDLDIFVAFYGSGSNEVWLNKTETSIKDGNGASSQIPKDCYLFQNYPNPFNAETTISFELTEPANITFQIFDLTGKETLSLIDNDSYQRGLHSIKFDAGSLGSGVYLYKLNSNNGYVQTKKMCVLK